LLGVALLDVLVLPNTLATRQDKTTVENGCRR